MKNNSQRFWLLSPRRIFQFFAREREESRLWRASLSRRELREISLERRRLWISYSVSFALHALIAFALLSDFTGAVLIGDQRISAESEADFKLMEGMISHLEKPVYDESSGIVVKPSRLIRKKDRRLLSLDNLLQKLRSGGGLKLSGGAFKGSEKSAARPRTGAEELELKAGLRRRRTGKRLSVSRGQLWDGLRLMREANKGGAAQVNYSEIMKVIDKHNFQFQECYELALLKDEKLSGKMVFLLKLDRAAVKKTNLRLEDGRGSPVSRRALLACLYQESKKLVFARNKRKITVKFNVIFGI